MALDFTRPGQPGDDGHIESFNGRLRDESLNAYRIAPPIDVRGWIEAWCAKTPSTGPTSLGHLTPREYARRCHPATDAEAA